MFTHASLSSFTASPSGLEGGVRYQLAAITCLIKNATMILSLSARKRRPHTYKLNRASLVCQSVASCLAEEEEGLKVKSKSHDNFRGHSIEVSFRNNIIKYYLRINTGKCSNFCRV